MDILIHTFFALLLHASTTGIDETSCKPHQILTFGRKGTIQCSFPEHIFAAVWYNSTDYSNQKPIITIIDGVKGGLGYTSGEFDISYNGSLVIVTVTEQHGHFFTVLKFDSADDTPVPQFVSVTVRGIHTYNYPAISECGKNKRMCFKMMSDPFSVECSLTNTRKPYFLTWKVKATGLEKVISFHYNVTKHEKLYTTTAEATEVFVYPSCFSLLVCEATNSTTSLRFNSSMILVQRKEIPFASVAPTVNYFELNSRVQLPCGTKDSLIVVWKRYNFRHDNYDNLSYSIFAEETFNELFLDGFEVGDDGTLIIQRLNLSNDGLYVCVQSNGTFDVVHKFKIGVQVNPVPAYPVIHGCNQQTPCLMKVPQRGKLTCSVFGIRPKIKLEWRKTFGTSDRIVFEKQHLEVTCKGDIFDVTLDSTYEVTSASPGGVTVECKISGPHNKSFQQATNATLIMLYDNNKTHLKRNLLLATILPTTSLMIMIGLGFLYIKKKGAGSTGRRRVRRRTPDNRKSEMVSMMQTVEVDDDICAKRKSFICELEGKYRKFYSNFQTLSYLHDVTFGVNDVYVNTRAEVMTPSSQKQGGETLESCLKDFIARKGTPNRCILEGPSGYGKTIFALQLLYNWCNKIPDSVLNDVEILIFFRLRDLGCENSIFHAIKLLNLPTDSSLSETDLKNIITSTSSTVIVFDGFDEYPNKHSDCDSDVRNIIQGNMFQEIPVIVTTRPPYLATEYATCATRVRLAGFNQKAREEYIKKQLLISGTKNVGKELGMRISEQPLMSNFFEIPLVFAVFANITMQCDRDKLFVSMTDIIGLIVSCFHRHLKNKMKDKDCIKDDFESNHRCLDKVAFQNLKTNTLENAWDKKCIRERIGQNFYDYYVKVGILVEENIVNFSKSFCIQNKTLVHFLHDVLWEWYAAHELAECFNDDYKCCSRLLEGIMSEDSDPLFQKNYLTFINNQVRNSVKDFNAHYIYPFTCGFNPQAADMIIQFLKNTEQNNNTLVLMCVLEQLSKTNEDLDKLSNLCKSGFEINGDKDLLRHTLTLRILKIASDHKVPVKKLFIKDLTGTLRFIKGELYFQKTVRLPVISSLEELWINGTGCEPLENEAIAVILRYATKSSGLKYIRFNYCIVPFSIRAQFLITLKGRAAQILWHPTSDSGFYLLNLETGMWKKCLGSLDLTEEEHERLVQRLH